MQTPTQRLVPKDLIDDNPLGILDQAFALQGLTSQQELLCKLMFSGVPQSDAYRQAYNCQNANPQTVSQMAARAVKMPKVVARMRQLQLRWEQRASLDALIRRDEIARGIAEIAFNPVEKTVYRLRALDMLAKLAGIDLYKRASMPGDDDKDMDQLTIDEIEAKLVERLKQLKNVTPSK